MKKRFFSLLMMAAMAIPGMFAAGSYGIPDGIQQGNILHCFNWSMAEVKAELPNIAAAGFGSVQLSPLQRGDIRSGSPWHDLYRPYDLSFKASPFMGSADDLKNLCAEAEKYGIKVIVDVVANHVDKTAGYHDTWWDSNGRVRWNGGINYGDRNSITHGQLGDYGDINSEDAEVIARGKAYVEYLKSLGVKGIRWDAAKHIGLPSEGCGFWSAVTSVAGMYHYGEILNEPGPNSSIIKEYAQYMSVTDNKYSNGAARENGGIHYGYGGDWVVNQGISDTKVVYWGESHDTYSNDEWSQNVDQSIIDRAYASAACRNGATALYFARPNAKGFSNIKVGKGSTAFKGKHIAEVNKFRNLMVGKADWFENAGNAISVTRKDGGAVIVAKGSGQVSVKNGGGYCPVGTYKDHVSGSTFTVTSTTISGNVGSSGIAVIYKDGISPDPDPDPQPDPDPDPQPGDVYVYVNGPWSNVHAYIYNETVSPKIENAAWPGSPMTKDAATGYWKYSVQDNLKSGSKVIINTGENGSDRYPADKQPGMDLNGKSMIFHVSGYKWVEYKGGSEPDPDPIPDPSDFTIYYDNSNTSWSAVYIHYWDNPSTTWPGTAMTKVEGNIWKYTFPSDPSKLKGFLFGDGNSAGGNGHQTDDYTSVPVKNHLYKGANANKGAVSDEGVYEGNDPQPDKPVVTATPVSGTKFNDEITVTLSVNPAATIYYTINGSAVSTSSAVYNNPLTFTETTTLKTLAVTAEGGTNEQTFTYTKRGNIPDPVPGENLITDYYKVNPNGQVGTNKTINMKFTKLSNNNMMCSADNALNNWTEAELIAQGVARDVAAAIRGKHEYPCIDSYAIYAAYDKDNLYLGVQYVYTVWDLYGDGKLTNGATKPYNMDGRLMLAFDLDPELSMDGTLVNGNTIWDADGQYNTFNNGTDCIWLGSTKSTVGVPGLFFPNADGKTSYDNPYCISLEAPFYGCADGLLPSIEHIWGVNDFGYDPEILKTNDDFVDLINEIPKNQHTFYEFRFPLSKLGITEDYIKNTGIGVMVIDTYGQGATGSTPYDPTCFDNAAVPYSKDESTSMEKEDKDIFTYAHARIGKMRQQSGVDDIIIKNEDNEAETRYFNLQGIEVKNPSAGIYIVKKGDKVTKTYLR